MDADTKKYLDRIYSKVNLLVEKQNKTTWISPGFLSDVTGWDREKMRQAREQGLVECKRSAGGGWLYKLESVPKEFIKTV